MEIPPGARYVAGAPAAGAGEAAVALGLKDEAGVLGVVGETPEPVGPDEPPVEGEVGPTGPVGGEPEGAVGAVGPSSPAGAPVERPALVGLTSRRFSAGP
jgi:integrin beta 8